MKRVGIKAQVGYRSPRARKGEASIVSPNRLQRQFNPDAPDERWVTDITYIRTHEGWLYLAVVVDLFSRKIIGCSMQSRMTKDIVLNALLMAVWRRNPEKKVLVHSDQGSQYTSHEWQSFLKSHGLEGSMSRRGNCHDNAVAESFFQLLKRERIKKKIYGTREEARSDIFDYIEMFYNSKRRHGSSDQMSPTEYENQYYQRLGSVQIIRGDSNKQKEAEEKARENAEVAEHETLNEEKQAVAEAEKRLAEAKAELAKAESDVQSKQATVSRVAGELENAQKSVDVKVTGFPGWRDVQKKLQRQLEAKQAEYSAVENELKNAVSFRDGKAAEVKEAEQKLKEAQDALEKSQIKDAVDTMVGFYQYITEQYGEKYAKIAQDLAEKSKGKKIQGVDEALAAFEKYKNVLDKKFSKVDRDAIFNALESVNYDELSKNLTKISKSLKITSRVSFLYDVGSDFKNAIETGNWRPLFVTLEKSAVDVGVAKIVALMFSFIVGVPLGFWGIAIVTGIVSSYIGDDELSKLNELLGI